jgi:medium-chain acyl-[acyl-carrier-protein] hydrolase
MAALRDLNIVPEEVLQHPELMRLMLPSLRADCGLAETYAYRAEPPPDVPISAYGGRQDSDPAPEELESWREQTTARFRLRVFHGGHLFLHPARGLLLEDTQVPLLADLSLELATI